MTLLLLRHGESLGNVDRLIQGWLELPLTERGRRQAVLAAGRLAASGAVALYTSPLRRARETAAPVAAATGLAPIDVPDLREYCFGEAQGLRWEEAVARWGLSDRDWGVGAVPGEEGMEAFRARVARRIEALAAQHADEVAICVVHGGVLGAVVAHLCGLPPHEHAQLYTGNCGIATLTQADGRPVILGLNDQCHLPPDAR